MVFDSCQPHYVWWAAWFLVLGGALAFQGVVDADLGEMVTYLVLFSAICFVYGSSLLLHVVGCKRKVPDQQKQPQATPDVAIEPDEKSIAES